MVHLASYCVQVIVRFLASGASLGQTASSTPEKICCRLIFDPIDVEELVRPSRTHPPRTSQTNPADLSNASTFPQNEHGSPDT